MKNLSVPACHKYVKNKNGEYDYQRIFGVTVSAYQTKYPNAELDKEEILRYLQINQIIPEKYNSELLNLEHIELCFTIISQFNCNAICQLCMYSPLFRNAHEKEESLILGYALRTWQNLQEILKAGVVSRNFRAMIPVSDKSNVMVVPLNRLAFEYLEKIPKSQEDMLSITEKIISLLRKNNQNKLSASDFKIAKKFLDNLYYSNIDDELLRKALKEAFNITLPSIKQEPASSMQPEQKAEKCDAGAQAARLKTAVHINGLLAKNPSPSKQSSQSKTIPPAAKDATPPKKVPNTAVVKDESSKVHYNTVSNGKEKVLSVYTAPKKSVGNQDINYIPGRWCLTRKILEKYKTIFLEASETFDTDVLQEDLLLTPLLPMEIITIPAENTIAVLFLANHKFYCYSISNPLVLDLLLPYITKSNYRKILCYDPYRLYEYFFKEQVYDVTITGLAFYLELYDSLKSLRNRPTEALTTICRKNQMEFPDILNLYKKAYLSFERALSETGSEQTEELYTLICISKVIGYSEVYRPFFSPMEKLIEFRSICDYTFTYKPGKILHNGYHAVSFSISWNAETAFPIKEMLVLFSDNAIFRNGSALLSFDEENIVFAVLPEHYDYLCNQIAEFAYQIGNKYENLPVTIKEDM